MDNPFVSVVVIAYNSSATIIETLESIRLQTFKDLELIVTDDCSQDDTIEKVESWMEINGDRFLNCELIKTSHNTGTSGNLNRGCKAAKGVWIKSIAADDRLLPYAIELYANYVRNNTNALLVISRVKGIGNIESMRACYWLNSDKYFSRLSERERRILLCCFNFVPGATVFIKSDLYRKMGDFDESIPLIEDWPYWLKFSHKGYHFDYIPEYTAEYRFSQQSISQPGNRFSKRYWNDYLKSVSLANQYMCSHGLLAKWYVRTKERKNKYKFDRFLLFINPFYWYIIYINFKVRLS